MRRETSWLAGLFATDTVAASTALLLTQLNAAALALRPFTVVRVRGILQITSDQAAANESQFAGFGMAVVTTQAAAIGITAVPTPVTDNGSDLFFLYQSIMARRQVSTGVSVSEAGKVLEIDSKAMRKVEDGQDLISVVELPGVGNGGAVFDSYCRVLIKLH